MFYRLGLEKGEPVSGRWALAWRTGRHGHNEIPSSVTHLGILMSDHKRLAVIDGFKALRAAWRLDDERRGGLKRLAEWLEREYPSA